MEHLALSFGAVAGCLTESEEKAVLAELFAFCFILFETQNPVFRLPSVHFENTAPIAYPAVLVECGKLLLVVNFNFDIPFSGVADFANVFWFEIYVLGVIL